MFFLALYTITIGKMSANTASASISAYINDVQANLIATLLSKDDAKQLYGDPIDENTIAVSNADAIANSAVSASSAVAPAGQRDLWQYPAVAVATGSDITYEPTNNIIHTCGNSATIAYSTDGGVTYTLASYDIAPVSIPSIAYGNGIFCTVGGTESYTSTNGINFTKRAALPTTAYAIHFFATAGLFIASINASASQNVMTSPDGLTWTIRNAAMVAPYTFRSNSTVCIGVSQNAPFSIYSHDGITWSNTSTLVASRAVAWSEEKKEWMHYGYATGLIFTSADGIVWTARGALGPTTPSGGGLLWVANGINRWYVAGSDADTNYSLWSTPDSTIAFSGTHLDGALTNSLNYSLVYLPSYDRFIIGTNSIKAPYSTARRSDIKSLGDNIRVRGSPVTTSKYSGAADFSIATTTTETTVVPTTSIGSLVYQAGQPAGMRIKFTLTLLNTSGAGDTLTLRFKSQAGTLLTHAIVVGAGASSLVTRVRGSFVARASTISATSTAMQSGVLATSVYAEPAYNRAIANTFSVTAQWGVNLSTCVVTQFNVSTSFINGA